MADINLTIGNQIIKTVNGRKGTQKIKFYFNYNSSGTLSIRAESVANNYAFSTNNCYAYIEIDGKQTIIKNHESFSCGNSSNHTYGDPKDFGTVSQYIPDAKTNLSVKIYIQADASGYGPTTSSGTTWNYSVSIPGVYKNCKAPTDLWVSSYYVNPGGNVIVSWSGAGSGENNSIQRYFLQWKYSYGDWDYWTTSYTNSSSSNISITVPPEENKYLDFRIRTEGSAGSSYYSGYYREDDLIRTRSRPTMSACSASQSLGTYTITWNTATNGIDNAVVEYEIWYSYKNSSSGDWSARTYITNVSSSTKSYKWSGGTVGYYYRFSVVAIGKNYSYSATTNTWSEGYKKDYSYTTCGTPSNLKSNNTNPTIGQTIALSWTAGTAGTNNSVTGYELYYSTNQGSTYNLISSSITGTSYSYTVPRTPGDIRFKIRTKGSAGVNYYSPYNYSSNYQTITIKQADPPIEGTVNVELIDYGSNGEKAFSINWAGFSGNTYNQISKYVLGYRLSKTIDDSDFSPDNNPNYGNDSVNKITIITSDLGASTTSYTWTGGNWNYYYKFYVKAKGQYYGESPYAESTTILKETDKSTPPTDFIYSGPGYINKKGQENAIAGLPIKVTPIGMSNSIYVELEYKIKSLESSPIKNTWIGAYPNILPINESFTVFVPLNFSEGDCIVFRAKTINISGDNSDYFPKESEEITYELKIKNFKDEKKIHPLIQVKRAYEEVWEREDNDEEGIRLKDGELGISYNNSNNKIKKIAIGNENEDKFSKLQYLVPYEEPNYTVPYLKITPDYQEENKEGIKLEYNKTKSALEFLSFE